MSIIRYTASADNTIVNAYQANLTTRATGANCGQADIVEAYSIYGRAPMATASATSGSQGLSRILMKFETDKIAAQRSAGTLPESGSVKFYLRLFNAETSKTVPRDFALSILPIAQAWEEGLGLDLENYKDLTKGNIGSNWIYASKTATWARPDGETTVGGSYLTGASDPQFKQTFQSGLEDIEIDISPLVEHWLAGTKNNHGIGIHLSSSYEAYYSASNDEDRNPLHTGSIINNTGGAETSYYTKRFFARGTQYFYKKPVIEARWDSTQRDDRGDFYYSSSLAPGPDNLNTLYIYNYVRGRLRNIPAIGTTGSIMVSLYSGSATNNSPSGSKLILHNGTYKVTGGYVSTGVYSASLAVTAAATAIETLYDVWWSGSHDHHAATPNGIEFFTGSIDPKTFGSTTDTREPVYYINITNLDNRYQGTETARFNLYVRNKYWNPTIYTKAKSTPEHLPIVSASYRVLRVLDAKEVVSHNTGSDFATGLSYDVSGNYFDFNMNLLEPGYEYGFKFAFYDDELDSWLEQDQMFTFRVAEYEY